VREEEGQKHGAVVSGGCFLNSENGFPRFPEILARDSERGEFRMLMRETVLVLRFMEIQ
jgi:hypothetical protein